MTTRRSLLSAAAVAPLVTAIVGSTQRAAGQDATPAGPPFEVEVERNVLYGEVDGQELLLDIYRPPTREQPRPAVVQIHGGGWTAMTLNRSDSFSTRPSKALAEQGYVVFNIDYRLTGSIAGENRWPAQLDDVQRAVRWLRANADRYGVDPERVGAYGHSAGGHLAAMLGLRDTRDTSADDLADYSSRVNAVVTISGDMDLTGPGIDAETVERLLGGTPDEVPDAYEDASPIRWVKPVPPPFLVIRGGTADSVPAVQVRSMVAALLEAGGLVASVEIPAADHMSIAEWNIAGPWASTFFAETLHPDR